MHAMIGMNIGNNEQGMNIGNDVTDLLATFKCLLLAF